MLHLCCSWLHLRYLNWNENAGALMTTNERHAHTFMFVVESKTLRISHILESSICVTKSNLVFRHCTILHGFFATQPLWCARRRKRSKQTDVKLNVEKALFYPSYDTIQILPFKWQPNLPSYTHSWKWHSHGEYCFLFVITYLQWKRENENTRKWENSIAIDAGVHCSTYIFYIIG